MISPVVVVVPADAAAPDGDAVDPRDEEHAVRRREVVGVQVVGIGVGHAVALEQLEPLRAHERRADLGVEPVVAELDGSTS